jgi:protein-disulfide isomerase
MTPRERGQWATLVSELLAPCPAVPVSIAQCIRESRPCGLCTQAAKWLAEAVRAGASEEQAHRAYSERFDPSKVKVLPIAGSPTRGPDDALVTVVEFADFQCPHCRLAVSLIDAVLAAHPDKVRLVYKSYTLSFHTRGEPAARAALAADSQGKFWEMEHVLFEHQDHLEDADLERYAAMLKINLPKWRADMSSSRVSDQIAADHALGESLNLKGTPTIYVNGRELDLEQEESLEARVDAELSEGAAPSPASHDAGAP